MSEKTILGAIEHPFIVNMFGAFQDKKYLYLVMEYVVGGEFFTHLRRAGRFNNDSSCFYAAQIVLIFQYLHSKDIVYRDLKPEVLIRYECLLAVYMHHSDLRNFVESAAGFQRQH